MYVIKLVIKGEHMFVGENISYLRKTMNLTQDDLAQKIAVSRQTISK